ncbi:MAG TPA: hypothetical protein VI583_01240 [Cyclobacteriaceae bacterium]|nr:hypothetical protein [Cyclobacteriaceae bacterium]
MNPLKQKLLNYLNHRVNSRNNAAHNNISFREARDFGVVFTWEGDAKYEQVRGLIKALEIYGKNIHLLCYKENKKDRLPPDIPVFMDRDVSVLGKVRSRILGEFLSKPFDFILHLDLRQNIMVQYILSRTHSKCRIGKTDMDFREFYEMMIQPAEENNFKDYCDQLIHYTKSIVTYA